MLRVRDGYFPGAATSATVHFLINWIQAYSARDRDEKVKTVFLMKGSIMSFPRQINRKRRMGVVIKKSQVENTYVMVFIVFINCRNGYSKN